MLFTPENHPVSTTEAQNHFGACLKKVLRTAEPVVVQKHGKPVAVILSYREWNALKGAKTRKKNPLVAACDKLAAKMRKRQGKQTSAVDLIRQIRKERS